MQPTVMHVPPTRPCSISTTLAPSWAARIAAGYPPGPPPRTATSHSIDSLLALALGSFGGILVDADRGSTAGQVAAVTERGRLSPLHRRSVHPKAYGRVPAA